MVNLRYMQPALTLFTLTLFIFVTTNSLAETARHYDWLYFDTISGYQTVTETKPNQYNIEYEYRDRGRGPTISATIEMNEEGLPLAFSASGHGYMGAKIDESFRWHQGKASWKNTLEKGEAHTDAPLLYLPAADIPEFRAIIIRYLLKQPSQRANIFPAGSLSVRRLVTHHLENPNGARTAATLYAINGIDINPIFAWLDDDLEFFAAGFGWGGMARKGWGEHIQSLQRIQDYQETVLFGEISARNSRKINDLLTVTNVDVFDSINGKVLPNQRVVITQGRIKSIAPDDDSAVNQGEVISGIGALMIPGLWEMHAHVRGPQTGLLSIAAGITSIRDMANDNDFLQMIKKQFDNGKLVGPNIFPAGFIDGRSKFTGPAGIIAEDLHDALDAVVAYDNMGYRQIKLYSSIKPEWVRPIANEAHSRGMFVSGHIPAFMNAKQAIEQGYDEITHINMLMFNFIADHHFDSRTRARITLAAEKGHELNVDSPAVTRFLQELKRRDIVVDPTLSIFEHLTLSMPGQISPVYEGVASHMPLSLQRKWRKSMMHATASERRQYQRSFDNMLRLVNRLYKNGVRIVPGTDLVAGVSLHRELQLYVKAGIPPAKVLQIATIESARVAQQDGQSGSIEVGKKAEFALVYGDPLNEITDLKRIGVVVKGDTLFRAADLHTEVGIKPFL